MYSDKNFFNQNFFNISYHIQKLFYSTENLHSQQYQAFDIFNHIWIICSVKHFLSHLIEAFKNKKTFAIIGFI